MSAQVTGMSEAARVEYLRAAYDRLRELVPDAPPPADVVILWGWSASRRRGTRGETAYHAIDHHHVITITPEGSEDGVCVLATMLHEMIHAALPIGTGHRPLFARRARGIGLVGPPTATRAGTDLAERLRALDAELGGWVPAQNTLLPGGPRQRGRLRRWHCPQCGQIIRAASDDLRITCEECQARFVRG